MLKKVIAIGLPFVTAGLICGFIAGRKTSPDAGKPETAQYFLALYGKWAVVDGAHGSLTLRAGNYIYSYNTGDAQVSTKFLSAFEIANNPPPNIDFDQDLEKLASVALAAPPSAGVVVALLKEAGPSSGWRLFRGERGILVIVASVATLGGAGIGYYLGHHSNPDYDNEIFRKTLQDTKLWGQFENDWRGVYEEAVFLRQFCRVPNEKDTAKHAEIREKFCAYKRQKEEPLFQRIFEIHPEIAAQVDSESAQTTDSK